MPRTSVTKTNAPGPYPAAGVTLTFEVRNADGNKFIMTGNDLLIVRNTHASASASVTINSVANQLGRTKDITAQTVAASTDRVFGPFLSKDGWSQGGELYFEASSNDISFAVVRLS